MTDASPQLLVAEVQALLERKRIVLAKARLGAALKVYPTHSGLRLQAAWADYYDGDQDAALLTVRGVLRDEPGNKSARCLLFTLLLEKGELPQAEQIILQLLRDNPEQASFYGLYSNLMLRAINLDKARALADEGIKYDPEDGGCLTARALSDLIERPGTASVQSLRQVLVRRPESERTLLLIITTLCDRGDHHSAYRAAQQLVRAHPDNTDYVSLASQLKATAHWSMLPLWPMLRWGWGASAALWLIGAAGARILVASHPSAGLALALLLVTYAIYSWFWPPLLRRWMNRI